MEGIKRERLKISKINIVEKLFIFQNGLFFVTLFKIYTP